jgi:hypothetical protein
VASLAHCQSGASLSSGSEESIAERHLLRRTRDVATTEERAGRNHSLAELVAPADELGMEARYMSARQSLPL